MANEIKTLPKIEDECQLTSRMTKRLLKSINNEIFDAFMEQTKCVDDMRKEGGGK